MDVGELIQKLIMSFVCIIILVEALIFLFTVEVRTTEWLLGTTMLAVAWLLIREIGGK